uniref:MalT-like TPR region domain-containing protein n=1 Tax=Odontella aurita TaxID=265563 RepID=A0A7S4JCU3_9STRA|mmetsp:Transcript_43869/g.133597  ORF Transcript_43869/g.133597 Transcript_43869/m.133597 type:complete len:638 (+) Transcript_43869:79-1992(+)
MDQRTESTPRGGKPVTKKGEGEDAVSSSFQRQCWREVHLSLAAVLNNAAVLHQIRGDYITALQLHEEGLRERMRGIANQEQESHSSSTPGSDKPCRIEAAVARRSCLEHESTALRQDVASSSVIVSFFQGLDMYPRPGTRIDLLNESFLPHTAPLEINVGIERVPRGGPAQTGAAKATDADTLLEQEKTSVSLYNIALCHLRSGSDNSAAKASRMFDMSISVSCPSADPVHAAQVRHVSAQAQMGLGNFQEAANEISLAIGLWREAVSCSNKSSCTLQLGIADGLSLLGRIHLLAGRTKNSLTVACHALDLRRGALGEDHVLVAANLYSIGIVLQRLGRTDEAIEHVRWFVYHPIVRSDDRYYPHLAEAAHALGLMQMERLETERAVDAFTLCIKVRRQLVGGTTNNNASLHSASLSDDLLQLGRLLLDEGRFEDALVQCSSALAVETALAEAPRPRRQEQREDNTPLPHQEGQEPVHRYGPAQLLRQGESEGIAAVLWSMGQIRLALGDYEGALDCYSKVLRMSRTIFGPQDEFVMTILIVIGNLNMEMGDAQGASEFYAEVEGIMATTSSLRVQEQENGRQGHPLMDIPSGYDPHWREDAEGLIRRSSGTNIGPSFLLQAMMDTSIHRHRHAAAA